MRLVAVVTEETNEDMPWNLVNQAIWANVEADFAIVSGELDIDLQRHQEKPSFTFHGF